MQPSWSYPQTPTNTEQSSPWTKLLLCFFQWKEASQIQESTKVKEEIFSNKSKYREVLVRRRGPTYDFKSFARAIDERTGNLTRLKHGDTEWPIGCSESESRRGLTSEFPMCKGGPVASLKVVGSKQRGGTHIYWSRQQNNSLLRFWLQLRSTTVLTACHINPLQCSNFHFRYIAGGYLWFPAIKRTQFPSIKKSPRCFSPRV